MLLSISDLSDSEERRLRVAQVCSRKINPGNITASTLVANTAYN